MTVVTSRDADLLAFAARYAATPDQWDVAPRFSPHSRWHHRLAVEAGLEVWLLTWLPGQRTDLHDHGGSAGAFFVSSGVLTEHTVDAAGTGLTPAVLGAGVGRRFGAHHIHQVGNQGTRPAVSIHVYEPVLTTMTRYEVGPAGLAERGIDRAGVQW